LRDCRPETKKSCELEATSAPFAKGYAAKWCGTLKFNFYENQIQRPAHPPVVSVQRFSIVIKCGVVDKKIPAVVLLASLTGEVVLPSRHEHLLPPHNEVGVNLPAPTTVSPISASGGTGGAMSATLTFIPNEYTLPPQLHTEVNVSAQMTTGSPLSAGGAGRAKSLVASITS
jgi:hypothetical protein